MTYYGLFMDFLWDGRYMQQEGWVVVELKIRKLLSNPPHLSPELFNFRERPEKWEEVFPFPPRQLQQ